MTKTEAKAIAKDVLQEAIGCAYYKVSDSGNYSEEDTDLILSYINKYGESACKAFGERYITY